MGFQSAVDHVFIGMRSRRLLSPSSCISAFLGSSIPAPSEGAPLRRHRLPRCRHRLPRAIMAPSRGPRSPPCLLPAWLIIPPPCPPPVRWARGRARECGRATCGAPRAARLSIFPRVRTYPLPQEPHPTATRCIHAEIAMRGAYAFSPTHEAPNKSARGE